MSCSIAPQEVEILHNSKQNIQIIPIIVQTFSERALHCHTTHACMHKQVLPQNNSNQK